MSKEVTTEILAVKSNAGSPQFDSEHSDSNRIDRGEEADQILEQMKNKGGTA